MHELHAPDFPVSVPVMIAWAVGLVVLSTLFVTLLVRLLRKGKRGALLSVFTFILLAGTCIHVIMLARSTHTVTDGNWIQLFLISTLASLEMFIGHTVVFDDIIAAVVFREPLLLLSYITVFVLAILFTISLFFLIVPRGLKDAIRLRIRGLRTAKGKKKLHIFMGDTPSACILAQSIRKNAPGDELLFIHFPDPSEKAGGELSIGEVLHAMFSRRTERNLADVLGYDHFMFIRGQLPTPSSQSGLAEAIGMPLLDKLLQSANSCVYILSDNEEHNFRFLQLLVSQSTLKAKVFCYNQDINNYTALYANVHPRIRLLNKQELVFTQVKRQEPDLMPVNVAPLVRDAGGNSLGYVSEGFNALIVGFGATGQEALRFIHEFGSFVGPDLTPMQNNYWIADPRIEHLKGEFLSRTPAFRYDANVTWSEQHTGSERFWLDFSMQLPTLNYVVISVDDGHLNVELAVRMLQDAARFGKDLSRLKILVKASVEDSQLPGMIQYYNRSFCPEGVSVIHPFGLPSKVWNLDVVTGHGLKAEAVRYRDVAGRITGVQPESWDARSQRIRFQPGVALANQRELHRRQLIDIDACLYSRTLYALAGGRIPGENDPMLPVLAASMQQYWVNALAVQGYILGMETDELNRRLPGMLSYTDLSEEEQAEVRTATRIALTFVAEEMGK